MPTSTPVTSRTGPVMCMIALLLAVAMTAFPRNSLATPVLQPSERVFASRGGLRYLSVLSQRSGYAETARCRIASYFLLDPKGRKVVGEWQLDFVPSRALISDWGNVVLIRGVICGHATECAITILDPDGTILRKYALAELITPDEIAQNTWRTHRGLHWDTRATELFEPHRLTLILGWGRRIAFDLESGEIIEE